MKVVALEPFIRKLPMMLVVLRGAIGPLLLANALVAHQVGTLFIALFAFAFFTDVIDGPIARRLGVASDAGARADSLADAFLYAPAVAAICIACTGTVQPCFSLMWMVLFVQLASWGLSLLKFGRLTSYHSTMAKYLAPVLFFGICFVVALKFADLFTVACLMWLLIDLEGIAMTLILPFHASDVRNIGHAFRLRKMGRCSA